MTLEFSSFVEPDLESAAHWIAENSRERAIDFLLSVRAALQRIEAHPLQFRLRPEIGEDARMAVVGRYVILFRVVETTVRIERVVFGGRKLGTLLPGMNRS